MKNFLTGLMFVFSLGVNGIVHAGTTLLYQEVVNNNLVGNTVHPGTRTFVSQDMDLYHHGYVRSYVKFSSSPAPFILASSENYIDNTNLGNNYGIVYGSLLYQLEVHGAANSVVPMVYDGQFYVTGTYLAATRKEYWPQSRASVSMSVGQTYFALDCVYSKCTKRSVGTTERETDVSIDHFGGWINGKTDVSLDKSGTGILTIVLRASAGAQTGVVGWAGASAFIDPKFYIDQDYLLANPGTTFALTPGVGNDIAAVPEPASSGLFLLGLGVLGLTRRVRSRFTA